MNILHTLPEGYLLCKGCAICQYWLIMIFHLAVDHDLPIEVYHNLPIGIDCNLTIGILFMLEYIIESESECQKGIGWARKNPVNIPE